MYPYIHISSGLIFSVVAWALFPQIGMTGAGIIFLSSFLIDVDHYIYYVYKKKNFSLINSVNWYKKNAEKYKKMTEKEKSGVYSGVCFLHGIEAIIVLLVLSFFYKIFSFVILGFIMHQAVDGVERYRNGMGFDKILSFTYSLYNTKNKKLIQEN